MKTEVLKSRLILLFVLFLLLVSCIPISGYYGVMPATVSNSYEFNGIEGRYPDMLRLGTSEYYLTVYEGGASSDTYANTTRVWNDNGTIQHATIDSLDINTGTTHYQKLVHVAGDYYAVSYSSGIRTFKAWSTNGSIYPNTANTYLDTITFTYSCYWDDFIQVSGNMFVIAYCNTTYSQGWLQSIYISDAGIMPATFNDTVCFNTSGAKYVSLESVDSNTIALAHTGLTGNDDGYVSTWNISASTGDITNTAADSWEFDTKYGVTPDIKRVSGDVYAIAYEGITGANGHLNVSTLAITSAGDITPSWIDTLNLGETSPMFPTLFVIDDLSAYGVTYSGTSGDGWIKTFNMSATGIIGAAAIDGLEFDAADCYYWAPIVWVNKSYYYIAYTGTNTDGWSCVVNITTNYAAPILVSSPTSPLPSNGIKGVALTPICSITISDLNADMMTLSWFNNSTGSPNTWVHRQTNSSCVNGTYRWADVQATVASTKYYWKVYANDTIHNVSAWFYFTTAAGGNPAPIISAVSPVNGSTGKTLTPKCNITVNDPNGNTMTIIFYNNSNGSPTTWMNRQKNATQPNGTYRWTDVQAIANLQTYYWKVSVNDGTNNVTAIYHFTTIIGSTAPTINAYSPSNGSTGIVLTPQCYVTVSDLNGDVMTITWFDNSSGALVNRGHNVSVPDGTYRWTDLQATTNAHTYWFKVMVYDGTYNISAVYHFTTVGTGTYYYVAKTGNDANTGLDIAHPLLTIQHAIQYHAIAPGNTICVRQGNYNEMIYMYYSGTAGNPITISGYPGEHAVLDGTGVSVPTNYGLISLWNGAGAVSKSYITIQDFTIENSSEWGIRTLDHYTIPSNNITLTRCVINNIWDNGVSFTQGYGTTTWGYVSDINVNNCTIKNIQMSHDNLRECVTFKGCRDVIFEYNFLTGCHKIMLDFANNTFNVLCDHNRFNNSDSEKYSSPFEPSAAIYVDGQGTASVTAKVSNVTISNNTIWGCKQGITLASEFSGTVDNVTIENNIINITKDPRGMVTHCIFFNYATKHQYDITIKYNTLYKSDDASTGTGTDININLNTGYLHRFVIANNIFVTGGLTKYQLAAQTGITDTELTLVNNLFYHTSKASNTKFGSSTPVYGYFGTDYVRADPKFVNLSGFDFHLNQTSPAIDVASATYVVSTDYDGKTRPIYAGYDIGSLEYGSTTPIITNVYPQDDSTVFSLTPICSIDIYLDGVNPMTVKWYENSTGTWVLRHTDAGVSDGTYTWFFAQASQYGKIYNWSVNVTEDSYPSNYITISYSFTTMTAIVVHNPTPGDGATGVSISATCLVNATVTCYNGKNALVFIWYFDSSGIFHKNTTAVRKNVSVSWTFDTNTNNHTYIWGVNAVNGTNITNQTFSFMTITDDIDILIDADVEFNLTNGVTSGAGTNANPYILDRYPAIHNLTIKGTTKYFIARDFEVTGTINIGATGYALTSHTAHLDNISANNRTTNIIYIKYADYTEITNCTFADIIPTTSWGIIYLHYSNHVKINNYVASRMTSTYSTGAIGVVLASAYFLSIENSSFINLYVGVECLSSDMNIENCSFVNNFDDGIFLSNSNNIEISNCYFTDETTAIETYGNIRNSIFRDNSFSSCQYSIFIMYAGTGTPANNITIEYCDFNENQGAIDIQAGNNITVRYCNFTNSSSSSLEHGILLLVGASYHYIHNCNFSSNYFKYNYNGIIIASTSYPTHIYDNLFYNNYFYLNTKDVYNYFSSYGPGDLGLNKWNTTRKTGTNIIGKPYLGGNYWDNYTGEDTDGDYLGDSDIPFNYDYHPLVSTTGETTVITNVATLVEETTATWNGVQTGLTGATCGFLHNYYLAGITPPQSPLHNVTCSGTYDSSVPFNYPKTGLQPGVYHYIRAWTYKSGFGYTYDASYKTFLTKPNAPVVDAPVINPLNISIQWTEFVPWGLSSGYGANIFSHFRYKTTGYPTSITDGTLLCNLSTDKLSTPAAYGYITPYSPSTTYYIRGWSFGEKNGLTRWSDTYTSTSVTTPASGGVMYVLTMAASNVEESTATLNGVMTGDNNTVCGFLINNGVTYSNHTCTGIYDNGETFSYAKVGMLYGDLYTFRAWSKNTTSGHFNYSATILTFLTKPIPPASETPVFIPANDSIRVNWSKSAVGAGTIQKTYLRFSTTTYPATRTTGSLIGNYTGDLITNIHGWILGAVHNSTYYISAWTFVSDGGLSRWSDTYTTMNLTVPGVTPPPIYNTGNPHNIRANWTTATSIYFTWIKGVNASHTRIIRKIGGWPTTITDGTSIYNSTGVTFNDTGRNPSIRYFYRAWGWSSTTGYSQGTNISFTETDNTSITTSSSASFKGYMATDKNIWTNFRYSSSQDFTTTSVNLTTKTEYYEGLTPFSYTGFYDPVRRGQTFTTETTRYYLYIVSFKMFRRGTPGVTTLDLYSANLSGAGAGLPTGAILASTTKDLNSITTATTGEWVNFTMPVYRLLSNTKYALVLHCAGSGANTPFILYDSPLEYAEGNKIRSVDTGATYFNETTTPTGDYLFRVFGHTPYATGTGMITSNETTTTTSLIDILQTNLQPGQIYYYKESGNDSNGNMTLGNMRYTLTNPDIPVFLNILPSFGNSSVKISWLDGAGANRTVVVRSNIAYPTYVADGVTVYNDTGSLCWVTNISFNTTYYFTLFSYSSWFVIPNPAYLSRFSTGVHIPWGGVTFIVYNESKPWQVINASMIVTDSLGLYPVQFNNIYGYYSFNISQIPYGENTLFYVSNTSYHSRLYPIDIIQNIFYNLSFYLPPLWIPPGPSPPGGNETGPYRIQIINDYQVPVQGALVKIHRYFNTTTNYTYIGGFVSDGNGQGSIDLYPFQLYMIKITCDGYIDTTEFWTPTVEEQSLAISKTFKIYHSIVPEPGIFDNLIVSIEPEQTNFYDSFTAYFNVTSSDAQLEWMTATMSRYNSTTLAWLCLFSQNITTTTGGSISYAVPNITGVYQWSCSFGKTGFSNYTTLMAYSILPPINNSDPLDALIKHIGGRSPIYIPTLSGETVASWSALIASFVAIFVLFGFSPKFSGLAVMSTGAILGVCKSPLGIIPNAILSWIACGFIIILGILMVMADKKEGGE